MESRSGRRRSGGRGPAKAGRNAAVAALIAMLSTGCMSSRIQNRPLEPRSGGGAVEGNPLQQIRQSDPHVVLMFSGGGTRAASLAYGVLAELRRTRIERGGVETRLLDHVGAISSVSGGSFTAAYYGLYGERIFEDFEHRFLRRDIDARLALSLFRPLELLRFAFTPYSRSDMAIDLYDREIFEGATFADLAAAGGPLLSINATDIDIGGVFSFGKEDFDLLCADLSTMRVAQAVTASSAVPGIFPPLLLENFSGTCGLREPQWIEQGLEHPRRSRRRHHEAVDKATYLDRNERPYIPLVDGGVADNIGARRIISEVVEAGDAARLVSSSDYEIPSSILYVVVNAQVGGKKEKRQSPRRPSVAGILSLVSGASIYRYNFETIELLRERVGVWEDELASAGRPLEAAVVEVAFDSLADPDERAFFNQVETSFDLDDETVDRLIEVGGRLLRTSPDFVEYLSSLQ